MKRLPSAAMPGALLCLSARQFAVLQRLSNVLPAVTGAEASFMQNARGVNVSLRGGGFLILLHADGAVHVGDDGVRRPGGGNTYVRVTVATDDAGRAVDVLVNHLDHAPSLVVRTLMHEVFEALGAYAAPWRC